ncbi:hypothetical protein ACHAQA_009427 [Verticillium albo-atrum]
MDDESKPGETQHEPSSQRTLPPSDLLAHLSGSVTDGKRPQPSDPTWIQDLELLHHFHAHSDHALLGAAEIGLIDEMTFVQLGLTDEGLMHQILAVSAFHKAFLHPSQRHAYSLRGLHHQTEAARTLRDRLLRFPRDKIHTCFVTAILLTIGSFAALSRTGDASQEESAAGCDPRVDDMMRIFFFARGSFFIMDTAEDLLKAGPLGKLFTIRTYEREVPRLVEICERLHDLDICVRERQHAMNTASIEAAGIVLTEIARFIGNIRRSILTAPRSPEWRSTLSWPMKFDDTFMALVAQKDHLALALMAYHCVAMHRAEASAWWTTGWAASVLVDIQRYLAGSACESLIEWPLHTVLS